MTVGEATKTALVEHANAGGVLGFATDSEREASTDRAVRLLQLIVSTGEFQFA
jgi:hypothetical protein